MFMDQLEIVFMLGCSKTKQVEVFKNKQILLS